MFGYILRRLLVAIPTILIIITVAFFMMRAAPGSPFDTERPMPEEVRRNVEAHFGIDRPLHEQYFNYMRDLAQFDFGPSLKFRDKTVSEIISEGFPVSATIGIPLPRVGLPSPGSISSRRPEPSSSGSSSSMNERRSRKCGCLARS